MLLPQSVFSLIANPGAQRGAGVPLDAFAGGLAATDAALREIRSWPGYAPTPLHTLDALAEAVGVATLCYKDEGLRFGIKSFKPFGGGYAVTRVLVREVMRREGGGAVASGDLLSGRYRDVLAGTTVDCATDGNHGRAIAWTAKTFGCRAVVYLASHVSPVREEAIAAFGADVIRTEGNHDDAVRRAAADAQREGWAFVTQMATATDPLIPTDIIVGYSALFTEVMEQWGDDALPTHLFVQCGVGGLAAAGAAYAELRWGAARPTIVVVEAEAAPSVYRSLEAGERVSVAGSLDTLMGGLAAGEVSQAAWPVLRSCVDFAVTIPDQAAVDTMRLLAGNNPAIVGGEAGVAGLAALLAVAQDGRARARLGLDGDSRVLTIGTEGATDPSGYERLVGVIPKT
jgi:diaminopropionate ammonia-lyase